MHLQHSEDHSVFLLPLLLSLLTRTQPLITVDAYYGFLTGLMLLLFLSALILIFVYEYDSLRRERT